MINEKEMYIGSNVICGYCSKEISAFSIFRHERECEKKASVKLK